MRYRIFWSNPSTNEAGALGQIFDNGHEADQRAKDEEKANPGRVYWATPVPESRPTGVDASGTDWDALDAMTDEDIQRQVDENPDAAPIITDFSGFTRVKPDKRDP